MGSINRVGKEKPWDLGEFYGTSYFVDPRGQVFAQASETEDVDRALLLVSARQENELLLAASSQQTADTRLAVLVLLTVLAICWHGLTLPRDTFAT